MHFSDMYIKINVYWTAHNAHPDRPVMGWGLTLKNSVLLRQTSKDAVISYYVECVY